MPWLRISTNPDGFFGKKRVIEVYLDLSSNNKDLIQTLGSRQPSFATRNNLDVVSFDGVDDYLTASNFPYNDILNYIIVAKVYTTEHINDALFSMNSSGNPCLTCV